MDKKAIYDRYHELEAELGRINDDTARRQKRAAQGPERLKLMAECKGTGNHVYVTQINFFGAVQDLCMFCGADSQMQAKQLARNLGTVAPFGRFN